ncbi:aminotransferase IV [Balneolaceae bacterium YR4-1]|uniref:branched-chain-amino-acid transaminase n=1 Tax=Halalkalibaculum roseum TaxID=2709311 RepID=A0A6M1SZY2_9BACT|nr:aminotransferase class IV [Halalkalibaculum roseum]NGP77968.1 aminotransferase IV [Halalkalibaculum roseum]
MTKGEIELPDARNKDIKVWIGDHLYPREEAKISVFDSVVQGGDAVWEGLRVYDGKIFALDEHLERLQNSAHALAFEDVPSNNTIKQALFETLKANGMKDETHIRLTLTRGKKVTSYMDPKVNRYGPTLIVLAEWKPPIHEEKKGLRLITSSIRRNPPQCIDSKIHHNNLINNILAKIEANVAGVDGAVMMDIEGYVSEVNATNIFFVFDGKVLTPFADSCLPGITRQLVIDLCLENDIPVAEKRLSMTEMYTADECFTTGTMGELAPAIEIDGRTIGNGEMGLMTKRLRKLHKNLTENSGEPLPF